MNHKLSIIIPCYNCISTLEEAVASIYIQILTTPFEVIMVDDGSTDTTRSLMTELSKKHPYITCYFNDKNKGGGATRNFGITKSTGDLIYCLDSDNIFAPDTVQKMIDHLDEKNCDGVAFSERRFFLGDNKNKYTSHFYPPRSESVQFTDCLSHDVLLDNFLYTKKSYLETIGYPEHHGFDTQSFEIHFLATGHSVYFCPETAFYHRQGAKEKSYFERVYESGEFSKNFYLIYEEIFFLFSPAVKQAIIDFNIFKQSGLDNKSLSGFLKDYFLEHKENTFIEDYKEYLIPNGFEKYMLKNSGDDSVTGIFYSSIYYYKKRDYIKSLHSLTNLAEKALDTPLLHYNTLRNMVALAHPKDTALIEKKVTNLIDSMQATKQRLNLNPSIISRIKHKLFK